MDTLEIITTSDGSHTLRNRELNETYHSVHGAMQESTHVFILNGLAYYHAEHQDRNIAVLEIGFGTGLNALLALQYADRHGIRIRYTTLEPFPLSPKVWYNLNYGDRCRKEFESIHNAGWDEDVQISSAFTLHKSMLALEVARLKDKYDVIFFDAFAPSVQPEMWTLNSLKKVVDRMNPAGLLVTYSAKGQVKRDLKTLGLAVETLPGPPGKLHMTRGILAK